MTDIFFIFAAFSPPLTPVFINFTRVTRTSVTIFIRISMIVYNRETYRIYYQGVDRSAQLISAISSSNLSLTNATIAFNIIGLEEMLLYTFNVSASNCFGRTAIDEILTFNTYFQGEYFYKNFEFYYLSFSRSYELYKPYCHNTLCHVRVVVTSFSVFNGNVKIPAELSNYG